MIERLVVVAAPSAAGKTRIKQELQAHGLPALASRLNLANLGDWQHVSRKIMKRAIRPEPKGLVLFECNLTPGYVRKLPYHRDELTVQLLEQAQEITFLTVWTPPARLAEQRMKREWQRFDRDRRKVGRAMASLSRLRRFVILVLLRYLPGPTARVATRLLSSRLGRRLLGNRSGGSLERLFAFYLRPGEIVQCYRDWLLFCERYASKTRAHIIAEFDGDLKLYSRDQWEGILNGNG